MVRFDYIGFGHNWCDCQCQQFCCPCSREKKFNVLQTFKGNLPKIDSHDHSMKAF